MYVGKKSWFCFHILEILSLGIEFWFDSFLFYFHYWTQRFHCLLACLVFNKKYVVILIFFPLYIACLFFSGCLKDFFFITSSDNFTIICLGIVFFIVLKLGFIGFLGSIDLYSLYQIWKFFSHYYFKYFPVPLPLLETPITWILVCLNWNQNQISWLQPRILFMPLQCYIFLPGLLLSNTSCLQTIWMWFTVELALAFQWYHKLLNNGVTMRFLEQGHAII